MPAQGAGQSADHLGAELWGTAACCLPSTGPQALSKRRLSLPTGSRPAQPSVKSLQPGGHQHLHDPQALCMQSVTLSAGSRPGQLLCMQPAHSQPPAGAGPCSSAWLQAAGQPSLLSGAGRLGCSWYTAGCCSVAERAGLPQAGHSGAAAGGVPCHRRGRASAPAAGSGTEQGCPSCASEKVPCHGPQAVLLHLLSAQVQTELCCTCCFRVVLCSQAWGCCCTCC